MPKSVDVYFSFRSPYSYLAALDMLALKTHYDVTVNLRPVLPIAVRSPEFLILKTPREPATSCWTGRAGLNFWACPGTGPNLIRLCRTCKPMKLPRNSPTAMI